MKDSCVRKKLNNKKGASLAIALVYFLLCATVGSIVLGAAMANISHVKSEKTNERSYLAVMSAGQVLKEQLRQAAGEWFLDHGEQDSQADEGERKNFKEDMLGMIGSGGRSSGYLDDASGEPVSHSANSPSQAMSVAMYQVYMNCVKEDNRLAVPADKKDKEAKGVSISFTFTMEDENAGAVKPVRADITFIPDYVIMDSTDSQQLQVRINVSFCIDTDETAKDEAKDRNSGQYYMDMSGSGVIYYTLEETITEVEGDDDSEEGEEGGESEPEYVYEYQSRVVISPDNPFFSKRQEAGNDEEAEE